MAKVAKKMALAMATTALGAALVGGASYALFTSQTTNAGNTFTAGTVVINDTTGGSLASQAVNFSNLAPGDNGVMHMTVKNNGTLDEWVHINNSASDATKVGKLAADSTVTAFGGLFGGTNPLQLSYDADVVKLDPGASYTFDIGYNFPLAADNSYQAANGTFSVVVDAVQARNNTNGAGDGPNSWN